MHIKLVSFLRLIVNSCIAELDLFKLTCRTLIFLLCVKVSGNESRGKDDVGLSEDVGPGCRQGIADAADLDGGGVLLVDGVVRALISWLS